MRQSETSGSADHEQVVQELQAALFPVGKKTAGGVFLTEVLQTTVKSVAPLQEQDWRAQKARLREPRELFALKREPYAQQPARWPVECQVLETPVEHVAYAPSVPEPYYVPSGRELQPRPVGEEAGTLVFEYNPTSAVTYFSRSAAGGTRVDPEPLKECREDRTLQFESRFESGNLAKAVKITDTYYELYLRTDLYTNRHMQWFYFQVRNTRANTMYRFSIVNLSKPESLYSCGMKPLLYSCRKAEVRRVGWHRIGDNIAYFKNDLMSEDEEEGASFYTLTFTLEFPYEGDTVYLAHCYPYTYTALQEHLLALQNHPVKSTFTKIRLLCRSMAGNNVYYLTVTEPATSEEKKKKPAVVVTARVHPGETPSSYMMKGLIDFLTGNSEPAKELRQKFIFKIVPMLNPDGVIVGNNRCSLTGRDLNRQYRTVIREAYPPVWHTKVLLRRLTEDCGIALYCDLHAHSRRHNVFIYGCESRRPADTPLQEQVFPLMMRKNTPDKFCFESCKFRIQRSKEGTGRVVMWMMGVANSYTMEASFGGSTLGSRADTHFSTADFEGMGRTFCETLLDYCDDEPSKISPLCSDEGDTSSCSDEGEEAAARDEATASLLGERELPPPHGWSEGATAEAAPLSPRTRQASPDKLSPKLKRVSLQPPERLSPPRQSLLVSRATLDLPDVEEQTSPRGRRLREGSRRRRSPAGRNAARGLAMPPELIVTQAQVYESSSEVTVVTETLPDIASRRPRSARPATGEPAAAEKHRTWQQLRSMPTYRAYYESHRVLVQRQAVEERLLGGSGSPPHAPQSTLGHMWGLQPPATRPRPKLQRQKSNRSHAKPSRKEQEEDTDSPKEPPQPQPETRSKKSKLKAKFKKTTLVTVACLSRPKLPSDTTNKTDSSPSKSLKSLPKPLAPPPKRKNKKIITRVQSTDF